jgi:hypothetical protein
MNVTLNLNDEEVAALTYWHDVNSGFDEVEGATGVNLDDVILKLARAAKGLS